MTVFIEVTEEKKKEPNCWCALVPHTYELIDRDDSLEALMKRTGKDVLFTRNWLLSQKI